MTSPKDLIPMKYEVIKLKTGHEFCGMVRDSGDSEVQVTLPMICQLTKNMGNNETQATFIPYAPLSSDPIVRIEIDSIMHRNPLNIQFVPFYDEAAGRWLDMVEGGNIPLTNTVSNVPIDPREYLNNAMQHVLETMSDEELDQWEDDMNAQDFENELATDKTKIH